MGLVSRVALKVSHFLDYFARLSWMLLMILVVGNVIMRPFGYPIRGTFELVEFATALAVGLSIAYCASQGGHVAATFLIDKLGEKFQAVVNVFVELVTLSFLGLVCWRMIDYANVLKTTGQVAQTTEISYYYFVYVIAFGFAAYFLVSLGNLIDNALKVVQR